MEIMTYDKDYIGEKKYIIKYLNYKNMLMKENNIRQKYKKINDKFIRKLYNYIKEGYDYVINRKLCRKPILIKKKIKFQESGYYLTSRINNIIKDRIKNQIKYSCKLLDREINIYIGLENNKVDYEYYYLVVNCMLSILYFLIKSKKKSNVKTNEKCCQKLDIYIYLTNLKKKLPIKKEIIGKENVNSGYSYICKKHNKIVIYRKEEWFKVFIHESLHAFGFHKGFSKINIYEQSILNNIFKLNKNVKVCLMECYVEVWARLLNITNSAYLNSKSYYNFKKKFYKMIEIERIYSIIQVNKILKFMDLTYDKLIIKNIKNINNTNYNYKENTNVLSYYVLSTICILNINDFLEWCNINNKEIMILDNNELEIDNNLKTKKKSINNFKITKKINNSRKKKLFINFIKDKYNNPQLIKILSQYYNNQKLNFNNGLRMSIIEFY